MRTLILSFVILMSCHEISGTDKEIKFTKVVFDLGNPNEKEKFDAWVSNNIIELPNDTASKRYNNPSFMYEDENFEVSSFCAGEWGGAALFTDKKNKGNTYHFSCTCPLMVDYEHNKYIITETLAHLNGFTKIVEINDPRILPKIAKDAIINDSKIRSDTFGTTLLDVGGITANLFYPFRGKNYLIYSKYDTTYLGEIINKKLIQKELLLNYGTWSYDQMPNKIKNGIYISSINHRSTNYKMNGLETTEKITGNIYFKQDTIVIGYQYSKTTKKT